ncbi:MAG: restriction endonuclease subunit S [Candidatus Pacebacteria bacterium]|nr:restriction endonuclease subunit S [Candidatus Paceibacterota bacterium]
MLNILKMKNSWQRKKLGEVCNVIAGQSPEGEFYNEQGNGLPFYQGKKEFTEKFIGAPRVWTTKITKESEEGDILMSVRAPVGPTNFTAEKICIGRGLAAIRAKKNIDKDFIFYFLRKFEAEIVGNTGAVFDSISKTQIENISIPTPPFSEQKRIVKILDEVFEEVGKAKENAEKNLRNSRELFESYLQSVFENKGEGWEEKRLGEIYDVRDGTHDSPKYHEKGFALITSKNLKRNGLNFDNIKYISEKDYQKINDRSKVDKGDILFAMIGTIGSPIVVEIDPDFAIKNVALFKVPKNQSNYFLRYYLDSKIVFDKMAKESKGTTQKFVGLGYLRDFKISLPAFSEQKAIVKKLDALFEETKKLEEIYKKEIADLEELKKSVLQKAFRGEL